MNCPNCAQTLLKNETRCWQCGFDVSNAGITQTEAGNEVAPIPPSSTVQMAYEPKPELNLLSRIKAVLMFDASVFEEIAEHKPWGDIAVLVFANAGLGLAFSLIYASLTMSEALGASLIPLILAGSAIGLVLSMIGLVIVGGLEYGIIRLLGGKPGVLDTVSIIGYLYIWTVAATILSIPFSAVGLGIIGSMFTILAGVIQLVENILAVERVHKLSRGKAALAVLITAGICVAVYVLIVAVLATALVTAAILGANPSIPHQ